MTDLLWTGAQWVRQASGWRALAVAFGAGTMAGLALPPFHLVGLLFVSFPLLVWLIDGAGAPGPGLRARLRGFGVGWSFGFGYFLVGLHWIPNALHVHEEQFGWAAPLALVLLPAGLALYSGLACWACRLRWPGGGRRVALLALCWTAAEWLRGHLLTGFPWNLAGYAWTASDAMIQVTAVVGIYGLTLITVAVAAAPAAVFGGPDGQDHKWPLGLALAALAILYAGGAARLAAAGPGDGPGDGPGEVPGVRLRIVQPNIDQRLKWRRDLREANLQRHLDLTRGPGFELVSHVVWPEAAVPYYLANDPVVRRRIGAALGPGRLLLTGSLRAEKTETGGLWLWNSFHVISPAGDIVASYDKAHLVPFGEYLPLRPVFSALGLEKLTTGLGDYRAGPGPRTLKVEELPPFSPLVCYEVIFPGAVVSDGPIDSERPAWMINVTNDAWFGDSAGPHQHLAMARVRAVEEGLPLVRAANTGISAIIDAHGRVRGSLKLGTAGVLDGGLPAALEYRTPYARWGDLGALVLAALLAALSGLWRRP